MTSPEETYAEGYRYMRSEGKKRLAFTLSVLVVLAVVFAFVPYGSWIFTGLALCYPLWGFYNLKPGRCEVCGTKTSWSMPRDDQPFIPRWFDLRPVPRSKSAWICPEHQMGFMMSRAAEMALRDRDRVDE